MVAKYRKRTKDQKVNNWVEFETAHFDARIIKTKYLVPALSKRGNLVPWSVPVARVHPRTANHY